MGDIRVDESDARENDTGAESRHGPLHQVHVHPRRGRRRRRNKNGDEEKHGDRRDAVNDETGLNRGAGETHSELHEEELGGGWLCRVLHGVGHEKSAGRRSK